MFKSTFNSSQHHQSSMENNNTTLNPNSFEALNINTDFVSDNRHQAKNIETEENSFHWSSQVLESVVILDGSGELPFGVAGGASEDCLCLVEGIDQDRIRYEKGRLNPGDLILDVQGEKVAGFIVQDLLEFLWSLDTNGGVVALKTISEEFLPKRLTQHLGLKFTKDSKDHQLQQTIRRNIYKRALPYTTRPPREGELDGVDYKFLSVEEFLELERTGKLLEKGVYEGNYYGTPRPDVVVSHIIPWNGLPEHLYSMVGKHNSTAVASAAGAASTTLTTFCSSTSPSSSNNSSANTTLLSPMIKREVETITQSGARDNEDALNNNNNSSNNVNNVSVTSQQYTPSKRPAPRSNQFHPDAVCSQSDLDPSDPCYGTQLITTVLVKGARGLGFTIVGIEDEDSGEVWLVVKNVMEGGPADVDGKLRRGDILMRVDGRSICGMSHAGVVQMFREFEVNQSVAMEVLRTPNSSNLELLDLEPCDPSLEVITAVGAGCGEEFRRLGIDIVKGKSGFGFTLADRPEGQKVKQLVDQERCRGLEEGDLLLQINDHPLDGLLHNDVVNFLKACPVDKPARFLIERRVPSRSNSSLSPGHKVMNGGTNLHGNLTSTFRNSPTSSFRPLSAGVGSRASPLDLRHHVAATSSLSTPPPHHASNSSSPSSASQGPNHQTVSPAPQNLSKLPYFSNPCNQRTPDFIPASAFVGCPPGSVNPDQSSRNTRRLDLIPAYSGRRPYSPFDAHLFRQPQAYLDPHLHFHQQQQQQQHYQQQYMPASCCVPAQGHHPSSCESLHFSETYHHFHSPVLHQKESPQTVGVQGNVRYVTLKRSQNGFGFRIVGGREEGTQVSVGYIVPGGPAHRDGQLRVGQEIVSVDGRTVMGAWHKEIVDLVTSAGQKGEITIGVRESDPYYDPKGMPSQEVILSRADGDGFGFYILSSGMNVGSVIGRILENSPASRAEALRVGDRILAINDTSIHGMKHEQIVQLIKSSGKTIKLTVSEGTQPRHPPVHQSGAIGIGDNSPGLSISARNTSSPNNTSPPQQPLFPPPPLGSTCCQYPRHDHPLHSQLCDVIHVELIRGAKGFGFSIRGGQDFGLPVYILKVTEDGPARADGRIQAGDEILKINGHPTAGLSHKEAINLVQSSAHKLNLVLRRVDGLESSGDL